MLCRSQDSCSLFSSSHSTQGSVLVLMTSFPPSLTLDSVFLLKWQSDSLICSLYCFTTEDDVNLSTGLSNWISCSSLQKRSGEKNSRETESKCNRLGESFCSCHQIKWWRINMSEDTDEVTTYEKSNLWFQTRKECSEGRMSSLAGLSLKVIWLEYCFDCDGKSTVRLT